MATENSALLCTYIYVCMYIPIRMHVRPSTQCVYYTYIYIYVYTLPQESPTIPLSYYHYLYIVVHLYIVQWHVFIIPNRARPNFLKALAI